MSWPFEPDAMRVACPVQRRLIGVIRWLICQRVIPVFYPMRDARRNAGDADRPWQWLRPMLLKAVRELVSRIPLRGAVVIFSIVKR